MFGNESKDYGKLKEDRRAEREDTRYIERCFKLGIGNSLDKMLAVVQGDYHAPALPNEPEKITASIRPGGTGLRRTAAAPVPRFESYEDEEPAVSRRATGGYEPPSFSKYAEVTEVLDRFAFSEDPEKRKKQFATITAAIRDSMQALIVQDVAQNTKIAFKDHMEKAFKINGGVQILFNFQGHKLAVSARGAFFGDETICVLKEGSSVNAGVVRFNAAGEMEDLSSNFAITKEKA